MAFHQPTRQTMQRVARPVLDRTAPSFQQNQDQAVEGSQTWVLFSPGTEVTASSYLAETEASLETGGRSLQTEAKSERQHSTSAVGDDISLGEDGELDSLDSHLPEFRSFPGEFSHGDATHVFPSHDGLGTFRLDNPAIGPEARDQIYQFEKYNPRRHHTRKSRESLHQEATGDIGSEEAQEREKRRRIEDWRLESSKCLLEEVRRETRRRRKSRVSGKRKATNAPTTDQTQTEDAEQDSLAWHDEDATQESPEGFLSRFTRTFIKDVLGLDDTMLSILTGETTIDIDEDLSSTPRASQTTPSSQATSPLASTQSWQLQVLDRVSHELGALVSHLSHHPGAFSTYSHVQQMTLPYAGLPPIPESAADTSSQPLKQVSQPSLPEFQPTYKEDRSRPIEIPRNESADVQMAHTFTKEEWEQDLDVHLVFRYLRNRFTSSVSPPHHPANPHTFNVQESAAKVARSQSSPEGHEVDAQQPRNGTRPEQLCKPEHKEKQEKQCG